MRILNNLSINKPFTINIISLFTLNGLNFILGIIILPKLISIFGIKGWGEIIFSQIIINYFIWIIDWSFPQYACKQISVNFNKIDKINSIFITTRTSQLILFLCSSLIISIYGVLFSINKLVYIYSIIILFGSFLQSYWYLNGKEKIYETSFFQLVNKILFSFFVFKILSIGDDISIYFLYFGISSLITGLLFTCRVIFKYKVNIKIGGIRKSIILIKDSSLLFYSSIIGNLTNSSIPFIIGYFYSLENLAIYNIADRIKNILIQILNPLSNVIFPAMSKENSIDKMKANNKLIYFIVLILTLGLIILMVLNINIEYIINYFLKEKVDGINMVVRILTFSFLINVIYESFINQYLVINNLFKEITKIKLLILFISFFLGIPLIYYKGIYGAALTNLFYELIGLICVVRIFLKTKNNKTVFIK